MVKEKSINLEKVEASLPGVNTTRLVTVSRAVHDDNKANVAPAAANCEYEFI